MSDFERRTDMPNADGPPASVTSVRGSATSRKRTNLAGFALVGAAVVVLALFVGARSGLAPDSGGPTNLPLASGDALASDEEVLTVSALLQQRAERKIKDGVPVTVIGFWSDRLVLHSCASTGDMDHNVLEDTCHLGEFGMTEHDEAIMTRIDGRSDPAKGPHLYPVILDPSVNERLFSVPTADGPRFAPSPIVVVGHFGDAMAADCSEAARTQCRDRFVIDQIVSYEPREANRPAPSGLPSIPPGTTAPFDVELCPGERDYAFVGWTTTSEIGTSRQRPGLVYALVSKRVGPIGDWVEDAESGHSWRWWGQGVCFQQQSEAGVIEFTSVSGTSFKEWDDGRRVVADAP